MKELLELIKSGKNTLLEQALSADPSLAEGKTDQGISLLQFAVYCRNSIAIGILRSYEPKLDLFEAASIGEVGIVRQYLEIHPEALNSFSADGFTPLGLASFFGHLPIVSLLLDLGADPNIASNNTFNVAPIHSACAISNVEIAEFLIRHGADVNAKQQQGVTSLHSAAHNGQTRLAKLLIDHGAGVNAKTDYGQTPLFMASEKNFHETAALIRKHGGH
jgi:ankyrin repeat protein